MVKTDQGTARLLGGMTNATTPPDARRARHARRYGPLLVDGDESNPNAAGRGRSIPGGASSSPTEAFIGRLLEFLTTDRELGAMTIVGALTSPSSSFPPSAWNSWCPSISGTRPGNKARAWHQIDPFRAKDGGKVHAGSSEGGTHADREGEQKNQSGDLSAECDVVGGLDVVRERLESFPPPPRTAASRPPARWRLGTPSRAARCRSNWRPVAPMAALLFRERRTIAERFSRGVGASQRQQGGEDAERTQHECTETLRAHLVPEMLLETSGTTGASSCAFI